MAERHFLKTTEIVKMQKALELCITNAGTFVTQNKLSKILLDGGVKHARVDKKNMDAHGFIVFATEEDKIAGEAIIPTISNKGRKLTVSAISNSRAKRSHDERHRGPRAPQKAVQPGTASTASVVEVAAPWNAVPYHEQLSRKQAEMHAALTKMAQRIVDVCVQRGQSGGFKQQAGKKRPRPADDVASASAASPASLLDGLSADDLAKLPSWMTSASFKTTTVANMISPVATILPSPITDGYRNKASFSIGYGADGTTPTIGFRLGSFEQSIAIAEPLGVPHISQQMQLVVAAANEFVRASPLKPYDVAKHTGVWRQLTVRWADSTQQCMVDLLAAPPGTLVPRADHVAAAAAATTSAASGAAGDTDGVKMEGSSNADDVAGTEPTSAGGDAMSDPSRTPAAAGSGSGDDTDMSVYKNELERFVTLMKSLGTASSASSADGSPTAAVDVTSVWLQEYSGSSQPDANHPHIHLHGSTHIRERMCGLDFDISPGAFFQVNTPSAERLYFLARALAIDGVEGGKRYLESIAAGAASSSTAGIDTPSSSAAAAASSGSASVDPTKRADYAIADVCCGTGTIGLVCAPFVGRVVGVEMSAEAIADADRNKELNSNRNAVFVCDKAENVMQDIVAIAETGRPRQAKPAATAPASSASGAVGGAPSASALEVPPSLPPPAAVSEAAAADSSSSSAATRDINIASPDVHIRHVVGIVDPPRGGLHPDVIKTLRTCKSLKRVVYVSCNPTGSLVEDVMRLCVPPSGNSRSTYAKGPEFRPVFAVPVDLFPHTPHCEMVVLFERP